jgi:hypothetical protein
MATILFQKKSNRFEILATTGSRKTNGFEWRCMRGKNVLYFAIGYDTFQAALKACKAMNKKLIKQLPVYHRGKAI